MQKFDTRTFQGLILTLQDYWARQGCTIVQPLDMEVGAGTSHPMTCLRALGPEPMAAAYVQPSRRPTDGRYGENPNRLQHYYQFQVVIKPSPDNIQELYLGSLKELGMDPTIHDIRFVEDNWENPTLGAWGLGWEVWLNGMEVTQFTYFQQVGGLECKPVTGEITYGEIPPYSVVVAGSLPSGTTMPNGQPGPSLYCAVIVKRVDEKTRSKTGINELLRD